MDDDNVRIEIGADADREAIAFSKSSARTEQGVSFTLGGEEYNLKIRTHADDQIREYDHNQPVALDDRDPGNTGPDQLTEPLDADDDVYKLVHPGT